ncbi:hypothetical protein EB796_003045 [Bugula neritina]|uniref:Uncharacterized protein n=1 Tax=Bugula neritina TaxID=10212 RepID=A0A7J7KIU9_BUGNE|nr:hypothetical protein EB796_003045 [Bugula neritina]
MQQTRRPGQWLIVVYRLFSHQMTWPTCPSCLLKDKISRMQSRSDSRPGSMASLRSLTRDGDSLRGGLSGSQRSIR